MSELFDKALRIATMAHKGQYRRDGETEYIRHPCAVAEKLGDQGNATDELLATALLHDVLEDTSVTVEDLLSDGIPSEVILAVVALTHVKGERYEDYIGRVKANEMARKVKVQDILHNLSDKPTRGQIVRYARSLLMLLDS